LWIGVRSADVVVAPFIFFCSFEGLPFAKAFLLTKGVNMKTFRTLELAIEFYDLIQPIQVTGHLRDQLLRAGSSISLNLSEGNARPSPNEKKRFYKIAYGSLKECQTIFRLLKIQDETLEKKADHLGASIYKLMNSKITVN
jgi:four helix bundle protein